jgi:DNA-binding MarR family transcriptional regulator
MTHAHVAREANLVGALALAVGDRIAEAPDPALGGSAAEALVTLAGTGAGGTIDSLAKVVGLTHSGAVRLVDRLAAAGLVERRVGADARAVSLHLTPQGRRAARRVLAAREAVLEQTLAPLTPAQRAQLESLLATMIAGVDDARICRKCDTSRCVGCPNSKARLDR